VAAEFFFRLAERANLSLQHFQQHGWWYGGVFLLGGRVAAILGDYRDYIKDPLRVFILWDGGFSFLGAVLGVAILLFVVNRGQRSTYLEWLDVLVPPACLGLVFNEVGAFLAGQGYGRPTDLPWAVTYDAMNVRYAVPVHPVQLYFAIFYLVLTFILLIVRKRASRAGNETLVGIVAGCVGIFLLEYFRGDFNIPVFATQLDFVALALLFSSLGFVAVIGSRLTDRVLRFYEVALFLLLIGYVALRPFLSLEVYELRFNQLLAVVGLLATVVYVVVHRRLHPHI
jgi:phosphatidylglycerol:prolipoprotein diacylglycerol transferase